MKLTWGHFDQYTPLIPNTPHDRALGPICTHLTLVVANGLGWAKRVICSYPVSDPFIKRVRNSELAPTTS